MVRVERFELITKLVLSQPPLPIGLHARADFGLRIADLRASDPQSEIRIPRSAIFVGTGGGIRTHTV